MRISTDVIVGYPGETEAEFEDTISAFKEAAFEMAFILSIVRDPGHLPHNFLIKFLRKSKRNEIKNFWHY